MHSNANMELKFSPDGLALAARRLNKPASAIRFRVRTVGRSGRPTSFLGASRSPACCNLAQENLRPDVPQPVETGSPDHVPAVLCGGGSKVRSPFPTAVRAEVLRLDLLHVASGPNKSRHHRQVDSSEAGVCGVLPRQLPGQLSTILR
jgi:hypothetical protein